MAMNQSIVSSHFPYLPIHLQVRQQEEDIEAFVDTGFDGDIAVAPGFITDREPADGYQLWRLADGSEVLTPYYLCNVRLGQMGIFSAVIAVLGDEPLIGQGLTNRFTVILNHGQQVIIEP